MKGRISWRQPGHAHFVPIDCLRVGSHPKYSNVTVVAKDGLDGSDIWAAGMACICGEWQEIEGPKKLVEKLMAELPAPDLLFYGGTDNVAAT